MLLDSVEFGAWLFLRFFFTVEFSFWLPESSMNPFDRLLTLVRCIRRDSVSVSCSVHSVDEYPFSDSPSDLNCLCSVTSSSSSVGLVSEPALVRELDLDDAREK